MLDLESKLGELQDQGDLKRDHLMKWARTVGGGGPRHWQGLGVKKVVLEGQQDSDQVLINARQPGNVITIWEENEDRTQPLPTFVVGLWPLPQDASGPQSLARIHKLMVEQVRVHPWVSKVMESRLDLEETTQGPGKSYASICCKLLGGPSCTWLHLHNTTRVQRRPYCPISLTNPAGLLMEEQLGWYEQFCGHLCGWLVDDNSEELLRSCGLSKPVTIKGEPMAAHDPKPESPTLPTINRKQSGPPHQVSLDSESDADYDVEEAKGGHDGTIEI